jgi:hypothetical protein
LRVGFRFGVAAVAVTLTGALHGAARAGDRPPRWFADRPVAWQEHDDVDLPKPPPADEIQELNWTFTIRDGFANEVDRILSLEGGVPALDVNAADEVPCSTWFCARNHLDPLTLEEVEVGPPAAPPRLPLKIIKGKTLGAAAGFQAVDADGHEFLVKFDPPGHLGMATGAEMIGNRVFYAAGYNVPGAFLVDLGPADLTVDPAATYLLYGVKKRALTPAVARQLLASVARQQDGRLHGVAIPWVQGHLLGAFDMIDTRAGDPNDRIPHELRRSLRASRMIYTWLSVVDPGPANTLDTFGGPLGGHFVRHYLIDFSCAFGSSTKSVQGLHEDGEYGPEVGRTLAALFSLGLYRRPFQKHRPEYDLMVRDYPAVGYLPADDFDPDDFRINRKNPAFMQMTERDAYWGAKVVTSFSNEQIAALVATGGMGEPDASYLERALRVRRDIIGRRYLRAVAAVERPETTADGDYVCFHDLAIARGYARPEEARYDVSVGDGHGKILARFSQPSQGEQSCLPLAAGAPGSGYRVVTVRTHLADGAGVKGRLTTKAARIHLRWRPDEGRFAAVGLERDE